MLALISAIVELVGRLPPWRVPVAALWLPLLAAGQIRFERELIRRRRGR